MVLRARLVLPLSQPPIEDGAVCIAGETISMIDRYSNLPDPVRQQAFDLGDVLLLPGLVNAHCHLDYTDMAGQLTAPRDFSDWI
jgi:cytosine/adenosine deaminase-related metal-dependent hydrolase